MKVTVPAELTPYKIVFSYKESVAHLNLEELTKKATLYFNADESKTVTVIRCVVIYVSIIISFEATQCTESGETACTTPKYITTKTADVDLPGNADYTVQ